VAPGVLEKVPAAQLRQVAALVAPTVVEYVPRLHWTHEAEPAAARLLAYVPAMHCVQTEAAVPPGFGLAEPAGQSVHEGWPAIA